VEEPREDFGHLPPTQQRKQLSLKLETLQASLNKETSQRYFHFPSGYCLLP